MKTDWTIEYKRGTAVFGDEYGYYAIYEFGVYPHSSVLAGQTMKSFRGSFATLEEAQVAHPQASVGYRDPMNTFDHLSDEEGVG